jgi:ribulose-5-phosphate 4-epimerase/fuculose-1-phosphate aldolase
MADTTEPREVVAGDFTAANASGYTGVQWNAQVKLAVMYRLAAHLGYDDTVWSHITMRVPGSDHDFFLNKFGLMHDEVTTSNIPRFRQ